MPPVLSEYLKSVLQNSLSRALVIKHITFDDELSYCSYDCKPENNDTRLEIGMQKLSGLNKELYYKFKQRTNKAEYGPVEIIDDIHQVKNIKITIN